MKIHAIVEALAELCVLLGAQNKCVPYIVHSYRCRKGRRSRKSKLEVAHELNKERIGVYLQIGFSLGSERDAIAFAMPSSLLTLVILLDQLRVSLGQLHVRQLQSLHSFFFSFGPSQTGMQQHARA